MQDMIQWAQRHNVSATALAELYAILAPQVPTGAQVTGESEAAVTSAVRLQCARWGWALWRNNVGMLMDETGRPVRYGLANESKQLNERIKSGDLIGWRKVRIEPRHVGQDIAQFVSLEIKRAGWRYTGKGREAAQMRWAGVVESAGGYARMVSGELPADERSL